jgi:hypothetical protein
MNRLEKYMLLAALGVSAVLPAHGQKIGTWKTQPVDVALMGDAERTQYTPGDSLWLYGASGEVAFNLLHKFGVVVNASGATTQGGNGGQSFSKVTTTAGPRFTVPLGQSRTSIFAEGLFGGSHGFNTYFPSPTGPQTSATSLAIEAGGGINFSVNRTWSVRLIDAHYVRTQFSNGATNRQQDLQLGAGIVWRPIDHSAK